MYIIRLLLSLLLRSSQIISHFSFLFFLSHFVRFFLFIMCTRISLAWILGERDKMPNTVFALIVHTSIMVVDVDVNDTQSSIPKLNWKLFYKLLRLLRTFRVAFCLTKVSGLIELPKRMYNTHAPFPHGSRVMPLPGIFFCPLPLFSFVSMPSLRALLCACAFLQPFHLFYRLWWPEIPLHRNWKRKKKTKEMIQCHPTCACIGILVLLTRIANHIYIDPVRQAMD